MKKLVVILLVAFYSVAIFGAGGVSYDCCENQRQLLQLCQATIAIEITIARIRIQMLYLKMIISQLQYIISLSEIPIAHNLHTCIFLPVLPMSSSLVWLA